MQAGPHGPMRPLNGSNGPPRRGDARTDGRSASRAAFWREHPGERGDIEPRYLQSHAVRPPDCISIYGLPMMCRWADRVPAHIIYAPVSL
jgi:hypothetical protein